MGRTKTPGPIRCISPPCAKAFSARAKCSRRADRPTNPATTKRYTHQTGNNTLKKPAEDITATKKKTPPPDSRDAHVGAALPVRGDHLKQRKSPASKKKKKQEKPNQTPPGFACATANQKATHLSLFALLADVVQRARLNLNRMTLLAIKKFTPASPEQMFGKTTSPSVSCLKADPQIAGGY